MVPTAHDSSLSGAKVLVLIDGSEESRRAALAAADLFASTPMATFTVLADASVATPDGAPTSSNGGLVQVNRATAMFMETVRLIEARGLRTSVRTTEGSLLAEASRIVRAHTAVVLHKRHAAFADEFPVPVILAP